MILHLISHFQPKLEENRSKIPPKVLILVLFLITFAKMPVKIPSSPTTIKFLPFVSGRTRCLWSTHFNLQSSSPGVFTGMLHMPKNQPELTFPSPPAFEPEFLPTAAELLCCKFHFKRKKLPRICDTRSQCLSVRIL